MLLVAHCSDAAADSGLRQNLFKPHMDHLQAAMDRFLLAAPLAIADGAAISGDSRLVASIFILDVPDEMAGRAIMEGDPYFTGRVWAGIAFYALSRATGAWADPESADRAASSDSRPRYVAFTQGLDGELDGAPLVDGRLRPIGNSGRQPPLGDWRRLHIFQATTLDEARTFYPAPSPTSARCLILSMPFSGGRWVPPANS